MPEHDKHAHGDHHAEHDKHAHGDDHAEHDKHAHHGDDHAYRSHAMQHDFSDVDRFARRFDNPERDAWQKPDEVIALMTIAPGMTVADIGAGTGYFLRHLSRAVGPSGRTLGLDLEPAMVEHMRARIAKEGLANAEAKTVATDDPGLAAASVDRILTVNTWHHIHDRVAYAQTLRASLRPGGQVVIVDFTMESEDGPPPSARLRPEVVIDELNQAGFVASAADESLPNQYVIIGRLP